MRVDDTWRCLECDSKHVTYHVPMDGKPSFWSCRDCNAEWTKR